MSVTEDPQAPPWTTLGHELSFLQTVPCTLTHRRALSEVFVADSLEVDEDEALLALQVPRAHSLWSDRRARCHEPLVMVEAARQATFVVVHRYVGVPLGIPFSLQRIGFDVTAFDAFADDEATPLEGLFHVRVTGRRRAQGGTGDLTGLGFEGRLVLGGVPAMAMDGDIVFLTGEDYEALRTAQRSRKATDRDAVEAPEPLDRALAGRHDPRNVVLGEPTGAPDGDGTVRYPLIVDQRHPGFFDHAQDHVPGPLIVEAYRQAALATARSAGALPRDAEATIVGCRAEFSDFAELDAPTECTARLDGTTEAGRAAVRVGLEQLGRPIAHADVELEVYP